MPVDLKKIDVTVTLSADTLIRVLENHGGYKSGICIVCGATGWLESLKHTSDCLVGKAIADAG